MLAPLRTYGNSRCERYVDENGTDRKRIRKLPMDQWGVLIREHHAGFIDWATYESIQKRLDSNTHPGPHRKGGVVREGAALLQGIGVCGHCGRRLSTHYRGRNSTPGYHCAGKNIVEGRGLYCLHVGGVAIDEALAPAAVDAMKTAVELAHGNHDTALMQWRLEIERLRYEAGKAERRYRAVEPENSLVARGLEADWEGKLRELANAEADLRRRESQRPAHISPDQLHRLRILSTDRTQPQRRIVTARNSCARFWRRLS